MTGRDWVALALAILAGLAVLAISIDATKVIGEVITPTEGELLAAILGAALGALSAYLGGRRPGGGPDA